MSFGNLLLCFGLLPIIGDEISVACVDELDDLSEPAYRAPRHALRAGESFFSGGSPVLG